MTDTAAARLIAAMGLEPVIHAGGTKSLIGGTLLHDSVVATMTSAHDIFIPLPELLAAADGYASHLLGRPTVITAGAASGCVLSAHATVMQRFGHGSTQGVSNIVTQRSHHGRYTYLYRQTGCAVVDVSTMNDSTLLDYSEAMNDRTAAIAWLEGPGIRSSGPSLAEVCAMAQEAAVPVIVDAAAMGVPFENVLRYLDDGADLVVVSGGKLIGGPQASGLVLGRPDLLEWIAASRAPHQGIGRAHKLTKDSVLGLLAALEQLTNGNTADVLLDFRRRMEALLPVLAGSRLHARVRHDGVHHVPSLVFNDVSHQFGASPAEVNRMLLSSSPRVYVPFDSPRDEIWVNPASLQHSQDRVVLDLLIGAAHRDH